MNSSKKKTSELFRKLKNETNEEMKIFYRNEIVKENQKLVHFVIHKRNNLGSIENNLDDMTQDGYIALIRAVENFNADLNVEFTTYAISCIGHQIKRTVLNRVTDFKYPINFLEYVYKVRIAEEKYLEIYEKNPSINELVEITNLSMKTVESVLAYFKRNQGRAVSLDVISNLNCDNDLKIVIPDLSADFTEKVELNEMKKDLLLAIDELKVSQIEKEMLKYRYGFYDETTYTLKEIGDMYNHSKQHVYYVCKKTLKKLKKSAKVMKHKDFYVSSGIYENKDAADDDSSKLKKTIYEEYSSYSVEEINIVLKYLSFKHGEKFEKYYGNLYTKSVSYNFVESLELNFKKNLKKLISVNLDKNRENPEKYLKKIDLEKEKVIKENNIFGNNSNYSKEDIIAVVESGNAKLDYVINQVYGENMYEALGNKVDEIVNFNKKYEKLQLELEKEISNYLCENELILEETCKGYERVNKKIKFNS